MRRLLAAAALLATACGPVLFAEAEFPRVCVAQPAVAVPAAPASGSVSLAVDVPLAENIPLLTTKDAENELFLDEVTLAPASGTPDLSGVESATVSVVGASGAPVEAARYTRDAAAPAPTSLVLRGEGVDLAPLLVAGHARLQLSASGRAPATPWVAGLTVCVHGKSKVPYP